MSAIYPRNFVPISFVTTLKLPNKQTNERILHINTKIRFHHNTFGNDKFKNFTKTSLVNIPSFFPRSNSKLAINSIHQNITFQLNATFSVSEARNCLCHNLLPPPSPTSKKINKQKTKQTRLGVIYRPQRGGSTHSRHNTTFPLQMFCPSASLTAAIPLRRSEIKRSSLILNRDYLLKLFNATNDILKISLQFPIHNNNYTK